MRGGMTVTVRRYTRNQVTGDRTQIDDTPVGPFSFDPGGTRENVTLGVQVTTTPKLYGPYDAAVTSDDEILIPGDPVPWEVAGDVARWSNPTGRGRGCVIELTRHGGGS